MGLMFEVAEGGFLDIDVRIVGPDGKTIHQVCIKQNLNILKTVKYGWKYLYTFTCFQYKQKCT